MDKPVTADRYHALDSLRGFAMFLGIVLHVVISFMVQPPGAWPIRDSQPTPFADVFLLAVHDFRMQTFFLLAGFFGCLLYQRYGVAGMVQHRFKRVVIPFALALVFIIPTVQAIAMYAEIENARVEQPRGEPSVLREYVLDLIERSPDASSAELVADFFRSGESIRHLPLIHLWFLYYLLFIYAAVAVLAPILGRWAGTRVFVFADSGFRWVVESRARLIVPTAITFLAMLPMRMWGADTPMSWVPQWHILLYYFGFFAFGWMVFRNRDLVATFGRGWKLHLVLANVLVLPTLVGFVIVGASAERNGDAVFGLKLCVFAISALYTWLMITGLWGAFLHWFAKESAWVRYLADASYWCYLASMTPILMLQYLVADWEMFGIAKIALITMITTLLLLASYHLFVRYTFIGAILNGRRVRPAVPKDAMRDAAIEAKVRVDIA